MKLVDDESFFGDLEESEMDWMVVCWFSYMDIWDLQY